MPIYQTLTRFTSVPRQGNGREARRRHFFARLSPDRAPRSDLRIPADSGRKMARVPARHWLLGDKAAVDDEFGAGDERGFVGGEEQHSVSDLDRFADAAQRRKRDL